METELLANSQLGRSKVTSIPLQSTHEASCPYRGYCELALASATCVASAVQSAAPPASSTASSAASTELRGIVAGRPTLNGVGSGTHSQPLPRDPRREAVRRGGDGVQPSATSLPAAMSSRQGRGGPRDPARRRGLPRPEGWDAAGEWCVRPRGDGPDGRLQARGHCRADGRRDPGDDPSGPTARTTPTCMPTPDLLPRATHAVGGASMAPPGRRSGQRSFGRRPARLHIGDIGLALVVAVFLVLFVLSVTLGSLTS